MISEQLTEIYQLLFDRFGPQHWWPGQTQFEIITGAILTQNTNWNNVEKAIANLKSADCLTPERLYHLDVSQLAELIRPAGYYNIKTKRLKNFLNWLFTMDKSHFFLLSVLRMPFFNFLTRWKGRDSSAISCFLLIEVAEDLWWSLEFFGGLTISGLAECKNDLEIFILLGYNWFREKVWVM